MTKTPDPNFNVDLVARYRAAVAGGSELGGLTYKRIIRQLEVMEKEAPTSALQKRIAALIVAYGKHKPSDYAGGLTSDIGVPRGRLVDAAWTQMAKPQVKK